MAQDLNNQELDALDQLLAETPEPLDPLDLVMLDGYLCGVLVQPRLVPMEQWLPPVFDLEGRSLPQDVDPAWAARVAALVERRHAALNHTLAEDGWFEPIVHDEPELATDSVGADLLRELPEPSRPLFAWAAGFQYATGCFPELLSASDEHIDEALLRVFRHLPPQDDEERELLRTLSTQQPLRDVDEAVEDLVLAVADLWELTREARYRVDTVRRDQPKVGRNDPCPCGSGRKFKQCHGR